MKTETKAVELTVDLTLLLLKSVLVGNVPGTLFNLIKSLVILCDLTQTSDTNRCSNRKLRGTEEPASQALGRPAGEASL